MQKTIWKFPLEVIDVQKIEIPADYEILTVQVQAGHPCLWALVDTDTFRRKIAIEIVGTGHRILDKKRKYIGSFQMLNGVLVYHCFESLEENLKLWIEKEKT